MPKGRELASRRDSPAQWLLGSLLAITTALNLSHGLDWPEFRGSNHDGRSSETIRTNWSSAPPRQIWKTPLTAGFSSLAVAGGRAFTLIKRTVNSQVQEVCIGLRADTGEELWARPLGAASYTSGGDTGASGNTGGDGPRSTPTVVGDRVFTLSGRLVVDCLDAATGGSIWRKDLRTLYGGTVISWQNAASPLVDGGLVFANCNAGPACLVALRASDGGEVWRAHNYAMTHSTPVAATIAGTRQILFMTQWGLVSVDPATGTRLWGYAFPYSTSTAASPVVADDIVYCSAGYDVGAGAVRVTFSEGTWNAVQLWRRTGQLMNHWSTPVYHEGCLYGLYGHGEYGTAPLKCVDLATGTERWSRSGFGPGGLVLAGNTLVVLSDAGELVLVKPDPAGYHELARVDALAGKCWSVPALSDGRLFARSTTEGICLDVAPMLPLALGGLVRGSDGRVSVEARRADGTAMSAVEAAGLELWAAPDLTLTNWVRIPGTPVLSNGRATVTDPAAAGENRRFYRVSAAP